MIVSKTYMGVHRYGKRTALRSVNIIERAVPAIVSEEQWEGAQRVLHSNRINCKRNTRRSYLLRGLIKCGHCGRTYSGMPASAPQLDFYYRCTGRQRRSEYDHSKKCIGKGLNGDFVERLVWADIESFLRNPGELVERLRQRLRVPDDERVRRKKELADLTAQLEQKETERERVLGLFRRGRINDADLDSQLDQINSESFRIHAEIESATRVMSASDRTAQLKSAEELLTSLRKRLDGEIPFELKRRIVEILVEKITANTVEKRGVQQSEIVISYRFGQPSEPAPLVLPRSHHLDARNRAPEQLNTFGDHLRQRRRILKLFQRQVAEMIGVDKTSVYNWETNRSKPGIEYVPAIIRFLGYNPFPSPDGWPDRLIQGRTVLGLTQKESANRMDVDPSTLARWERGERKPTGAFLERVLKFLAEAEANAPAAARIA